MENTVLNIELPKPLKNKARRDAKKNDMSMSQWVRKLIKEAKVEQR